ncbi:MAG: hypothetical protein PHP98_06090 [Kiritimatiellae bacterium]|nr:hypothetical protein [Kiritimatiellia bacterium]
MKTTIIQDKRAARLLRAGARRKQMAAHRANNFGEAEEWDFAYWQSKTPQDRLSALAAIHADVEKVKQARHIHEQHRRF